MQLPELDSRLNFIASFIWAGCRPPFLLLVQCAQEPAGEAAAAFLDIGLDGILRSFFRPKGLRSGRHGKKRRKGKSLRGVPEISDIMADRVEGLDDFRNRPMKSGTNLLWEFDTIGQRIIGEIAIIDITSEFLFKSLIGVLKLKQTHCAVPGRAFIRGGDGSPNQGMHKFAIQMPEVEYVEEPTFVTDFAVHVPVGDWQVIASATVIANSNPAGGNADLIFGVSGGSMKGEYQKEIRGLAPNSVDHSIFGATLSGPATLSWSYRANPGILGFDDVKICVIPTFWS